MQGESVVGDQVITGRDAIQGGRHENSAALGPVQRCRVEVDPDDAVVAPPGREERSVAGDESRERITRAFKERAAQAGQTFHACSVRARHRE